MIRRALSSLLVFVAASLLLATASDATTPGLNGRIVFVSYVGSPPASALFSTAPDGSDALRLTWTNDQESSPAVSPDGSQIAWTRFGGSDGRGRIWLMNADGSGQHQLTPSSAVLADDSWPTWSPDGDQLAFASSRPNLIGGMHVWIVGEDGTNLHQLNDHPGYDPSWSPDGTRIAFTNGPLYLAGTDGGAAQQLTTPPTGSRDEGVDWAPDGSSIVFARRNALNRSDLYTIAPDGTGQHQLTTTVLPATWPSWSPDGTKIVFTTGGSPESLYEINADGSSLTHLTGPWGLGGGPPGATPSWGTSTVRPLIDLIPPSIDLHSPADGAVYAMGGNVSVEYACTDELSGIAACNGTRPSGAALDTSRAGSYAFRIDAVDRAGHITSSSVTYTVADQTPPLIDLMPPRIDLHTPTNGAVYAMGSNVSVEYSCTDELSGIAACNGTLPSGAALDTSRAGSYAFQIDAADRAGHITSSSATYTVADQTPPTITITGPADGAAYLLGANVSPDYRCTDEPGGSGVQTCTATPIDTTTIGRKTFTVTATDNAGNSATTSSSYAVIYAFDGFYSPTAAYPTASSADAGQSVKLRFSLHGNQGLDILATAPPAWRPCAGDATTPATGTLAYQTTLDRYTYETNTPKSWATSCRDLTLTLRDGTVHTARFRFGK